MSRAERKRIQQPRHRREHIGELVQIDGSEHRWFEDRAPACTLLVFVDDATSRLMELRFVASESTFAYFETLKSYLQHHGKPVAFYSDKHSIFRVSNENAVSGNGMTQFGRALSELNIGILCANTSQAKGRVERAHHTLQDRLVKELRLARISTIAAANAFLPSFVANYNVERQVVALLRLRQAAARQSCRHCREQAPGRNSGLDQGTARPAASPPHHSEGATALKSDVRTLEEPGLANGRGRQIEAESAPPRPAPLRYGGLRGAGSCSQRRRRVTFQLCAAKDISTWLQQGHHEHTPPATNAVLPAGALHSLVQQTSFEKRKDRFGGATRFRLVFLT
jgi:hypothetical protein